MSDKALQAQQDTVRLPVYDVEGFRTDWPRYDQTMINCFAEVVRNNVSGEAEIVSTKRPGIVRTGTLDFSSILTDDTNSFPIANIAIPHLYDVYVCAYIDPSAAKIRIIQYRPVTNTILLLGDITLKNASDKVHLSYGWVGDKRDPNGANPLLIVLLATWEAGDGSDTKAFKCTEATYGTGLFATATFGEITDALYPSNQNPKRFTSGPILQLNNQFYVATIDGYVFGTGTNIDPNVACVYGSDTSVPTYAGWSHALNYTSSLVPERFHTLIHYKHHLLAVGRTTIQFFNDVGGTVSPGIPLAATDQAFVRFGAVSSKHVINVDDIIYWIAYGKDNTMGLWKLEGYTPVKISSKKQDKEITACLSTGLNSTYLSTLIIGNKKHILFGGNVGALTIVYGASAPLQAPDVEDTYRTGILSGYGRFAVYSLEDKTWWYLTNGKAVSLFPVTSFGNPYGTSFGPYVQYILRNLNPTNDATTASNFIYKISEGTYIDDHQNYDATGSWPVTSVLQLNSIQFQNEKRKKINKLKVIMSSNFAVDIHDANVYRMYVTYSKKNVTDDIADDVVWRPIRLPSTTYRYYVNNLGMARNICFCFIEATPYPMSIKAIELDLAQGVS